MANHKRPLTRGLLQVFVILSMLSAGCGPTPTPEPSPSPIPMPASTLLGIATPPPTQTPIVIPTPTLSPCMARTTFGDAAESPYVLPFPPGQSYRITQSYCDPDGGHVEQLAYDFAMPIGDEVIAARAGTVLEIREDTPDISRWEYYNQHNYVLIQHADGTVAFYAHLQQDSVVVQIGQLVEQGQQIASSGNSGMTGGRPHLHFGVYAFYPLQEGFDVPVSFRNVGGQLDARGGLMTWHYYWARPYQEDTP